MKTMIFAAGLGTRLKPLTDTLPKALVPVSGKPLIEHVTARLENAGVEEAVVNVHHFADKIEKWVEEYHGKMKFHISDERQELLETGGGILHARRYLEGCGTFLIHNVDILSDLDIRDFASKVRPGSVATLLVSERKTTRYLLFDSETMRLKGWINVATGEVRSPYADLDPSECRMLAFSGIHILSDKVFEVMDRYVNDNGLNQETPCFPIMDFYLSVCAESEIYGVQAENLNLVDVGKLDTLQEAEAFMSSFCRG